MSKYVIFFPQRTF